MPKHVVHAHFEGRRRAARIARARHRSAAAVSSESLIRLAGIAGAENLLNGLAVRGVSDVGVEGKTRRARSDGASGGVTVSLRAGDRVDLHHFLMVSPVALSLPEAASSWPISMPSGDFGELDLRASDRRRSIGNSADLEQFALSENQSIAIARAVEQIQMLVRV